MFGTPNHILNELTDDEVKLFSWVIYNVHKETPGLIDDPKFIDFHKKYGWFINNRERCSVEVNQIIEKIQELVKGRIEREKEEKMSRIIKLFGEI